MTNLEKYNRVLMDTFNLDIDSISNDLNVLNVDAWDSMGQMQLATAIEENFGITLDEEDILYLTSYKDGLDILKKHGVEC